MRSTDGGLTWTWWSIPQDKQPDNGGVLRFDPKGIAGIDQNRAVIVGDSGKVTLVDATNATTPTWTFRTLGLGYVMNSVAARDADHMVAVGEGGLIMRTSTGMSGWSAAPVGAAPTLILSGASGITSPASNVVVRAAGTATSHNLGVAAVQLLIKRADGKSWNGGAWAALPEWVPVPVDALGNFDYQVTVDDAPNPTPIKVSVRAVDGVGLSSGMQSFTSDKGAPTTNASGIPASWTNSNVTVTLTAGDPDGAGDVADTFYRLGSDPTVRTYAPAVGISVSTQGATTIAFWSVDKLGNAESEKTATVFIDKTVPTSAASGTTFNSWISPAADPKVLLSTVGSDGYSAVTSSYRLNSGATTPYSPISGIAITSEGTTTIEFWSQDAAGNVETPDAKHEGSRGTRRSRSPRRVAPSSIRGSPRPRT